MRSVKSRAVLGIRGDDSLRGISLPPFVNGAECGSDFSVAVLTIAGEKLAQREQKEGPAYSLPKGRKNSTKTAFRARQSFVNLPLETSPETKFVQILTQLILTDRLVTLTIC
jgi:hypothetical protein